ncbi:nuclease [Caenimonas sedimenti]|uniref:phospholipase D n=1 Tax=Caenimonas sedimenti TaxID=2596921 RepID=A0A562ZQH5_9BURK|nr:phospholipase D-like domain-containing protein [Caenimonas sedimenti]TWO70850.1 nuclease [Caenimonas sedimenti]
MSASAGTPFALLVQSLADDRLADDEKRAFAQALRETALPPEGMSQLRNEAFGLARERLAGGGDAQVLLRWLEGVLRAVDSVRAPPVVGRTTACFSPGMDCLNTILRHFREARRSVDLCVFTLSDDRITREVLAAHQRGVALRFVTDNTKEFDAGSDVAQLRRAGVPVVVDRTEAHMHHKFAIFDGVWLLNGSYNWTRSACDYNEENLVASNDPGLVRQFQGEFEQLWQRLGA